MKLVNQVFACQSFVGFLGVDFCLVGGFFCLKTPKHEYQLTQYLQMKKHWRSPVLSYMENKGWASCLVSRVWAFLKLWSTPPQASLVHEAVRPAEDLAAALQSSNSLNTTRTNQHKIQSAATNPALLTATPYTSQDIQYRCEKEWKYYFHILACCTPLPGQIILPNVSPGRFTDNSEAAAPPWVPRFKQRRRLSRDGIIRRLCILQGYLAAQHLSSLLYESS